MAVALRPLSVSSPFDDVSLAPGRGASRELGLRSGVPKSSFLAPFKLSPRSHRSLATASRRKAACRCESRSSGSYEHIPKQFREENLKKGCKRLVPRAPYWKAKELDANTDYYLELLAKGIGKPKEEIEKDIQRPKYFLAQDAIAYGIADKIIDSRDAAFEKRNYDEMLAQSKAMRRAAGAGPQAAPSGFR
ncbi:hypothetical protein BHE74_00000237 [Ensete ventricosum]|nr:hypothetical protein GW17_00025353 [Ensete ventricosum]RWW90778.1 hypothetical protein BHE74_00000237 [Ensete ventricosum]RZS05638.1 hypothetical protein BHM03_00036209 [Ensete ventricosum]